MTVQFAPAAMSADLRTSKIRGGRRAICHWPKVFLAMLMALLLIAALSACKPAAQAPPGPPPLMNVGITGYNFTDEGVQEYYVEGTRVSTLPPYGGGGKTSCCVSLPERWAPELKVTVDWTIGHYTEPWDKRKHMTVAEETACCWTQRTLSKAVRVERYDEKGGGVQVFFLPDDKIQVWVSNYGLGHDKHPSGMSYPRNPNPEK